MKVIDNLYIRSIAPNRPNPHRYSPEAYQDWIHIIRDDSWPAGTSPKNCAILAFPGSGAKVHPDNEAWVNMAIAQGYMVISCIESAKTVSGANRIALKGYGSTAFPSHYSLYIQNAWIVENLLQYIERRWPNLKIIMRGQSLGGGAVIAWSSLAETMEETNGYPNTPQFAFREGKVLGVTANGMTSAGLGGLRWNDVYRVMNYVAAFATKIKKRRVIISYGSEDDFAPQDFSRSIQLALPKDSSVSIVYPTGDEKHGWINSKPALFMEFINAIYDNRAPVMETGIPAVPGNGQ